MDDFNGKFCKNGSFPVIRSVKNCFDKQDVIKTTTRKLATAIAANDGAKPVDNSQSLSIDEFDSALSQPNDFGGVDGTNGKKNSANKNVNFFYFNSFFIIIIIISLF
jgi:hypothetical protein